MDGSDAYTSRSPRRVYEGPRRKIVLAFDVGTTFSGISYSILDPGQPPVIKGVTRFPAQEHISGASKIPSIVYYDKSGAMKAIGAEALRDGINESAVEQGWYKAEWFKLHLRDRDKDAKTAGYNIDAHIPALPPNKSVVDIFADIFAYLFACAREYVKDSHPNGAALWDAVVNTHDIDFVLSHPNGWEGKEQAQMRGAAVQAKLIPDTDDGHTRVSFVTEGEASLHYAVECGVLGEGVQIDGVIIVDAGGGTIDISTYGRKTEGGNNIFNEITTPQCRFHGSVFVTLAVRRALEEYLRESQYLDDLDHIVRCFDQTTKLRFRSTDDAQFIKFGSTRDNDADHGIRFGQLKVLGSMVANGFQPSVDCITEVVQEQKANMTSQISHVVLVGGFASSDWLFNQVKTNLNFTGIKVLRPENHVNKAVSDGAISYYLDHYVRARIARLSYGEFVSALYDERQSDHKIRSHKRVTWADGTVRVPDYFDVMLSKGTQVSETMEFKMDLYKIYTKDTIVRQVHSDIWCYKGNHGNPRWRDVDSDGFRKVCTISANLSRLPSKRKWSLHGFYYRVDYAVIIHFGLTEMQAQLEWTKSGKTHRSTAKVIFDK